ncbi:MAG: copper resistance protein CopC [Candidatus Planktophila sp.]
MKRQLASRLLSFALIAICTFSFFPASAHTSLSSSTPKAGSELTISPLEISLQFEEELLVLGGSETNRISVTNDKNQEFVAGQTTVNGSVATAQLDSPSMKNGSYLVSYRVVAVDGHVLTDEYSFEISGTESTQPSSAASQNLIDDQNDSRPENEGTGSMNPIQIAAITLGVATIIGWVFLRRRKVS